LEIDRQIGDRRGEGADLGNLGNAYLQLGDPRRAIEYYEHQLVITRQIGDRRGEGNALGNLGSAYKDLGDARRAIGCYEQTLEIHRQIGDRRGEGADLGNLGIAYKNLGDARRAIGYYEQQLVITRQIGDRVGEANGSFNLAVLYLQQNQPALARPLAQLAADFFTHIGHPEYARRARALLAQLDGAAPTPSGPSAPQILAQFGPLIQAVIDAEHGNLAAHQAGTDAFDALEQNGWHIAAPIRRIWNGERDAAALTAGLDESDSLIIRTILERLGG